MYNKLQIVCFVLFLFVTCACSVPREGVQEGYKVFTSTEAEPAISFFYPEDISQLNESKSSIISVIGFNDSKTKGIFLMIMGIEDIDGSAKEQAISDERLTDKELKVLNEREAKVGGFDVQLFDILRKSPIHEEGEKTRYLALENDKLAYMFSFSMLPDDFDENEAMVDYVISSLRILEDADSAKKIIYPLSEDVIVHLAAENNEDRTVKLKVQLILTDQADEKMIAQNQVVIHDCVIRVVRGYSFDEMRQMTDYKEITDEITSMINERLGTEAVLDVLFENMQMQ